MVPTANQNASIISASSDAEHLANVTDCSIWGRTKKWSSISKPLHIGKCKNFQSTYWKAGVNLVFT